MHTTRNRTDTRKTKTYQISIAAKIAMAIRRRYIRILVADMSNDVRPKAAIVACLRLRHVQRSGYLSRVSAPALIASSSDLNLRRTASIARYCFLVFFAAVNVRKSFRSRSGARPCLPGCLRLPRTFFASARVASLPPVRRAKVRHYDVCVVDVSVVRAD